MKSDISCLPLEVLEKILSNLHGECLIQASQVCWRWACIAHRMMVKTSDSMFSPELREDIRTDIRERLGARLLDLYRESVNQILLHSEVERLELQHHVSIIEADGPRIYIGDGAGNLQVYEVLDSGGNAPPCIGPKPVVSALVPDGPIVHLGLIKSLNLVVATSPSILYIFSTREDEGGHPCLTPVTPSIAIEHKSLVMRVHRDLIGVTEGASNVKVYRVLGIHDGEAELSLEADFTTPCGIFRWKMWNNQVMCVLKTGALVVWDLKENEFSHVSEPYNELRYQNPCWLYQRYVMCSSELSRNLLCRYIYMMPTCPSAYWHISCGPSYWLFGRLDGKNTPEPEKYRGVLPPDVTTMCLRRRVLVCARRMPNQLMVYLMPPSLPHDKDAITKALQTPLLTLPAPDVVQQIDIAFRGPRLYVFSMSTPSVLHCYVLTRDLCDPSVTSVSCDLVPLPGITE